MTNDFYCHYFWLIDSRKSQESGAVKVAKQSKVVMKPLTESKFTRFEKNMDPWNLSTTLQTSVAVGAPIGLDAQPGWNQNQNELKMGTRDHDECFGKG